MALKTATPELIQELVDRIVREFDPVKVILFGSHARGGAGPDSDIDLLVVMDDPLEDEFETSVAIMNSLYGLGVAKDIFVTTPAKIASRGHGVNTVLHWALRDGETIYAR